MDKSLKTRWGVFSGLIVAGMVCPVFAMEQQLPSQIGTKIIKKDLKKNGDASKPEKELAKEKEEARNKEKARLEKERIEKEKKEKARLEKEKAKVEVKPAKVEDKKEEKAVVKSSWKDNKVVVKVLASLASTIKRLDSRTTLNAYKERAWAVRVFHQLLDWMYAKITGKLLFTMPTFKDVCSEAGNIIDGLKLKNKEKLKDLLGRAGQGKLSKEEIEELKKQLKEAQGDTFKGLNAIKQVIDSHKALRLVIKKRDLAKKDLDSESKKLDELKTSLISGRFSFIHSLVKKAKIRLQKYKVSGIKKSIDNRSKKIDPGFEKGLKKLLDKK